MEPSYLRSVRPSVHRGSSLAQLVKAKSSNCHEPLITSVLIYQSRFEMEKWQDANASYATTLPCRQWKQTCWGRLCSSALQHRRCCWIHTRSGSSICSDCCEMFVLSWWMWRSSKLKIINYCKSQAKPFGFCKSDGILVSFVEVRRL